MKIRNGFVSNSSSSSFVVGRPETKIQRVWRYIKWHSSWVNVKHRINRFTEFYRAVYLLKKGYTLFSTYAEDEDYTVDWSFSNGKFYRRESFVDDSNVVCYTYKELKERRHEFYGFEINK